MTLKSEMALDLIFHALSDSTRRKILKMIVVREYKVTELAEPFKMSLNAISKHLKVLERAGLLNRTIDGRVHRCAMNYEPMYKVANEIEYYKKFWESRLDELEKYLHAATKIDKLKMD
ncbi:MAG: winged helix-turn-helix transcriptional regulator [Oligoflexales bacterium]|nr:winged helix-turn-helix transcriptional regulator [Oligoflexales bacterium]